MVKHAYKHNEIFVGCVMWQICAYEKVVTRFFSEKVVGRKKSRGVAHTL